MNNLSIKRVWEDEHMFEIEVVAQSEHICAKARTYLPFDGLNDLAEELEHFLDKKQDPFLWEVGECCSVCSYISLFFAPEETRNRARIEARMEICDMFSESKHNCHLAFCTDVGLLRSFGRRLRQLCISGIGKSVSLNEANGKKIRTYEFSGGTKPL